MDEFIDLEQIYPERTYTNSLFKQHNINPLNPIVLKSLKEVPNKEEENNSIPEELLNEPMQFVLHKWKIFTIGCAISIVTSYSVGMVKYGEFDRGAISYDHDGLVMGMITWWPDCKDRRSEIWRLYSSVFSHANFAHFASNMLGLLLFAFMVELYQPAIRIIPLFVMGTIHGNLAFYFAKPYYYAIGVSQGVFALLGMNFANVCLNVHALPWLHSLIIFYLSFVSLAGEMLSYDEANNIAYICHWGSLVSGFLGGLFGFRQYQPNLVGKCAFYISLPLYFLFTGILMYRYVLDYPPLQTYTNTLSPIEPDTCCQEWFVYENDYKNATRENFRCTVTSYSSNPSYYKA